MSGIFLGLDTATPFLSLALWHSEGVLASFCENLDRDHAKRIILELDQLLQQAGLSRSELSGIGVGLGPGSYTGIRVGLATAQGLARGLNLVVRGVSTLEAMAYASLSEGQSGIVALNAHRGLAYAGVYQKRKAEIRQIEPVQKIELASLGARHPMSVFLDRPPSASYLAQQVGQLGAGPAEAIYL